MQSHNFITADIYDEWISETKEIRRGRDKIYGNIIEKAGSVPGIHRIK